MLIHQKICHESIYQNMPQDIEVIAGYVRGIRAVTIKNNCLKDEINFMRQKPLTFSLDSILAIYEVCHKRDLGCLTIQCEVLDWRQKIWFLSVNFGGG